MDRIAILEKVKGNALIVEIGAASGCFTKQILATCKEATVFAIDIWAHQEEGYNDACNLDQQTQDERYRQIQEDFKDEKRVTLIREWSHQAAEQFEDESIDLIYLDANHSEDAVFTDLITWLPKLKRGGIFAGHDYDERTGGVKDAVNGFCEDRGIKVHTTTDEYSRKDAVYGPSWEGKSFYFIKP